MGDDGTHVMLPTVFELVEEYTTLHVGMIFDAEDDNRRNSKERGFGEELSWICEVECGSLKHADKTEMNVEDKVEGLKDFIDPGALDLQENEEEEEEKYQDVKEIEEAK